VRPALPDGIDTIMSRCLQKNAAHRYPSAQALLADVQQLASLISIPQLAAHQPQLPAVGARAVTRIRENWAMALSAIALVSMLALGVSVVGKPTSRTFEEPVTRPVIQELPAIKATSPMPTASAHTRQGSIRIDVLEGSADVYRAGKKVGTTPYQFTGKPGDRIDFTLKRKDSHDLHQTLDIPEKDQPFVFQLEKVTQR
jgi:hypothetical protein